MPSTTRDNNFIQHNKPDLPEDWLTLAALSIGAYILADLTHEAFGHGGICLASVGAIFIAGDDSEAKAEVARLVEEIGFAAVDTGFLNGGGLSQQPGTAVYNKQLTAKEAAALLSSYALFAIPG